MFLGHFAVALGAKAAAPRTSLGTLFLAAQFIDLLWPSLLLLGIERVDIVPGATAAVPLDFVYYPFSHSLLAVLLWALLFALFYYRRTYYTRGAWAVGLLVLSHWWLDTLVHRPDLPLYPGGEYFVGVNLWSSLTGTLLLESLLFAAGVVLYLRAKSARCGPRRWIFWGLIVFLMLVYLANLFGSPPPNVQALGWVGQAQWLLVLWAYWADRQKPSEAPATVSG